MRRRPAATTTQAVTIKAEAAADALLVWLRTQPTRTALPPTAVEPASERDEPLAERLVIDVHTDAVEPDPDVVVVDQPAQFDLAGAAFPAPSHGLDRHRRGSPLRLNHTDWLHHRLLIGGAAVDLVRLREAAGGAGTVPWHVDFDRMEEDLFHLLLAPPARIGALGSRARSLGLAGARILAGQLRAAAARRHALATARVGHSRTCPFDLHALVPVPDAILRRGPDDPAALDWLWTHWGTTQTLRLVAEDETAAEVVATRRAAVGQGAWALTFWSADWTPWRALAQVAARWPTLRFEAHPLYDLL
jgi:hypothetical protein